MIRRRPSHATVVAYLALFVALSGSAYAIGRGEVKTRHLAKGAVTTPKIRDGAVTAPKVRDGSIGNSKLREHAVTSEKIADGAISGAKIGAQQVTGNNLTVNAVSESRIAPAAVTTDKLRNGAVTPAKLTARFIPAELTFSVPPGTAQARSFSCPTGAVMLSGGGGVDTDAGRVIQSYPIFLNSWHLRVGNPSTNTIQAFVRVLCLRE